MKEENLRMQKELSRISLSGVSNEVYQQDAHRGSVIERRFLLIFA